MKLLSVGGRRTRRFDGRGTREQERSNRARKQGGEHAARKQGIGGARGKTGSQGAKRSESPELKDLVALEPKDRAWNASETG